MVFIIIDKNKIIDLYNQGLNSSDIAKELNIRRQAVYEYLKENNLKSHNKKPLSPRKISEEDINKIITLYNDGLSLEKIRKFLNLECTASAIRGLLIRRNIQLRKKGKIPNFDEKYFENIDDPHKAYWLGFIYADGNITKNRLKIEVRYKDIEILNNIKKDLKSDNKIIKSNYESSFGIKNNVSIGFCSDKMKEDLEKYGIIENKTHKLKSIPNIDDDLKRHFIRGYFDGDGTVYMNSKSNSLRFGFYGTKELLSDIQNYLSIKIGLSVNLLYEKIGCWLLSYSKKEDINKFYDYIYIDSDLFLNRKKNKFKENMKR